MKLGQAVQLEHILGYLSTGIAILDATTFRISYINPYLHALLEEPWNAQDAIGQTLDSVLSPPIHALVLPILAQVMATGEGSYYQEVPYEGFLQVRGRTYWNIAFHKPAINPTLLQHGLEEDESDILLVTVEDVTDTVRSRLHLNAIHHISAAMAGAYALPHVLDRILQSVQEMVGSTRCAIFLIEHSVSGSDEQATLHKDIPHVATIAAQKGVHLSSFDWRPMISNQLLLGRATQERKTLVLTNTNHYPDIDLPLLDDEGVPRRPGSVLCVPIFEPYPLTDAGEASAHAFDRRIGSNGGYTQSVIGTIEVYHRRARGFPAEEVRLLEQFAQQAGLAIENARLFRRIDQWARVASRNAHQRKNVMLAIPDGVVIYGPRWRVVEANHAARKLLGWSDEVIGLPMVEAMKKSTAVIQHDITAFPHPTKELEQRALQGQIDEFKMVSADGKPCTMRCSYTPIQDELGDTFAYIVIYHDVTKEVAARERIEAEVVARTKELAQRNIVLQQTKEAQEMERAQLALLLERLPSGVILTSAHDTSITIINYQAVQLLQRMGLSLAPLDDPDEAVRRAIGQDGEQLLRQLTLYGPSGSTLPYEQRPLYLALKQGQANEAELHAPTSDGQNLYLLVSAAPLRAASGTITSAILVLHDITHIKTLERAREDFFTTMAHELKTPLANIRAHLSALLATDLEWSIQDQQEFLQTADEQVERLVGMINHVLDASRVEAGALRLELEPILLPEMLEDLQERLEALIASSHRQLKITMPPSLPAVIADYELIMSVLTNLLSNAFRYAPEGDVVLLEVEPMDGANTQQPSQVRLAVIDRGPGMTQEQQAELFTRFSTFAAMSRPLVERPGQPTMERRRGSARWSPATGLGLYISRGIIEAHGSTLSLVSNPGQGATFSFQLPVPETKQVESDAWESEHIRT